MGMRSGVRSGWSRRWSAAALAAVLVVSLAGAVLAATGAPPVPELEIEAPPSMEHRAAEIGSFDRERLRSAMRLAGLDRPGPPIRVLLAPEDSNAAQHAPPWVAGYAVGEAGVIVLFPARAPSYPDRSLEALLHHEVAHVLIDRAAAGRPVPRWFHEGVALAAGRAWNIEDRFRFAFQRMRGKPVALAELDAWFREDTSKVHRAYAVAGAFVHELLSEHGPSVTGEVLEGIGRGLSFEDAFRRATGERLAVAETRFLEKFSGYSRWLPFLTSSVVLWMAVTGLALVAIWRRRRRDAELHRRWEEEEEWVAPRGAEPGRGTDGDDEGGWVN